MGSQATTGYTKVTNGKKKLKKHLLNERRVLFARNSQSHTRDPRDITFEVNTAHVAVRLNSLRYTEKGNLFGVMREDACAGRPA